MDNNMDSENITPPSSPIFGYSGLRDYGGLEGSGFVMCFCCKGQPKPGSSDHYFSSNGYLLRHEVINALTTLNNSSRSFHPAEARDSSCSSSRRLCKLFNSKWDPTDFDQLNTLLSMAKMNLNTLEVLCDPLLNLNLSSNQRIHGELNSDLHEADGLCSLKPWELRKEVCLFFNVVLGRLKYYRRKLGNTGVRKLFDGFKKSLGKASNWIPVLKTHCGYKEGNDCTAATYHNFHLQWEIRWSLLIIYGAEVSTLKWILNDMIYLAFLKYLTKAEQPYNCWCVKELWTMIRLLIDDIEGLQFWDIYAETMNLFPVPPNSNQSEKIYFTFWLTSHIAALSDYSLSGTYEPGRGSSECASSGNAYSFINSVLKEWVTRGGKPVEITNSLQELVKYWGFDLDVVVNMWNCWVLRIDKSSEAINLEHFSTVEKWKNLIKELNGVRSIDEPRRSLNSREDISSSDQFFSFLQLLVGHAALCSGKEWKKLKSHIGMKLNRNNVSLFGEIGVYRVSTLYLSLAYATEDSSSMADRLQEILSYTKESPGRKKTVFRAKATMLILLLQKSVAVSSLELVKGFMLEITKQMSRTLDAPAKDIVMIYLEFLDLLPTTPNFNSQIDLNRDVLICPNLTMWLSSCGDNYLVRTLRILNKLTGWIVDSRILNPLVSSTERDKLSRSIYDKAHNFVYKTVAMNVNSIPATDIQPVAFLAADFTFLAATAEHNSDTYSREFHHYALNEWTCPDVTQFYISRLCSYQNERDSSDSFINLSNFSDVKWAQVWIRLIALNCSVPDSLNTKLLGQEFKSTSNEALLQKFCSMKNDYSKTDIQSILQPLLTLAKGVSSGSIFKEPSSTNIVQSIVAASLHVLKEIGFELLYSKSDATSFAVKILEIFVPPPTGSFPWEKLPAAVLQALRSRLVNVFEAMTMSSGYSQDSYLSRKTFDILAFAFLGFVGSSDEAVDDNHPAIKILLLAEDKGIHALLNLAIPQLCRIAKEPKLTYRFVYGVAALRNKGLTSSVIRFLPGVISIFVSISLNAQSNVNLTKMSKACVNIIEYACVFGQTPFQPLILNAFEKSFESDFAFKNKKFFEISSHLTKCSRPQVRKFLRVHLLPVYQKYVDLCERRRGIGIDNALRGPLEKLDHDTKGFDSD